MLGLTQGKAQAKKDNLSMKTDLGYNVSVEYNDELGEITLSAFDGRIMNEIQLDRQTWLNLVDFMDREGLNEPEPIESTQDQTERAMRGELTIE